LTYITGNASNRKIGRADELGSGVRNLYKYVKLYSGKEPLFDEEDVFTLSIPLDKDYNPDAIAPLHPRVHHGISVTKRNNLPVRNAIMEAIHNNAKASARMIADTLDGVSAAQIKTQMAKMQMEGLIVREGPSGHGGRWKIKRE